MKRKPTKKAAKQANKSKRYTPEANAPKKTAPPKAAPSRKKRRGPPAINRRVAFLKAFAICGRVNEAAAAAKIDRTKHWDWLHSDPEYAAAFQRVKEQASQEVEDEISLRAMRGVYEPYVFQGKVSYPQEEVITPAVVGPRGGIQEPERREWRDVPGALPFGIWRKSDRMMELLARALMPEKYGFRGAMEVTGPQGGPIEIVERLNAGRARLAAMVKPDTA